MFFQKDLLEFINVSLLNYKYDLVYITQCYYYSHGFKKQPNSTVLFTFFKLAKHVKVSVKIR